MGHKPSGQLKLVDGKTVADFKFFTITELPQVRKRKTRDYEITSKRGVLLGHINWYTPWRQHTFQPAGETVWSDGCMADIQLFLNTIRGVRLMCDGAKQEGVKAK